MLKTQKTRYRQQATRNVNMAEFTGCNVIAARDACAIVMSLHNNWLQFWSFQSHKFHRYFFFTLFSVCVCRFTCRACKHNEIMHKTNEFMFMKEHALYRTRAPRQKSDTMMSEIKHTLVLPLIVEWVSEWVSAERKKNNLIFAGGIRLICTISFP